MELTIVFLVIIIIVLLNKIFQFKNEKSSFEDLITRTLKKGGILVDENVLFNNQILPILEKLIKQKLTLEYSLRYVETQLEVTKSQAKVEVERLIAEIEDQYLKFEEVVKQKDDLYSALKVKSNSSISKITSLYSDFILLQFDISEKYLNTKKHPAKIEAKRVSELKNESKLYLEQFRTILYKFEYLLSLFPELSSYVDDFETLQQLEDVKSLESFQEEFDKTQFYLTKEEWSNLTVNQRNQLALDRYLKGQKTNWQIGRDYELFCGRELEIEGWNVEYFGMEKKLEDLGRDLIARKNFEVKVVQCKYWSQSKLIHEKHILQLFGTSMILGLEMGSRYIVKPLFITNIELSSTAKTFASILNVDILKKDLKDFPRIKCNINKDEYNMESRIYHLPFDQQYDRTKIKNEGEFYATTVSEAVSKGFRRAFRHTGY